MMKFELLKVPIIDILEVWAVEITKLALDMGAHPKMDFEGLEIIEPPVAELAERMVQDKFTCFAELPFSLMPLDLEIIV